MSPRLQLVPEACGDQILCHCLQVSQDSVVDAIDQYRLNSIREVQGCTGAGGGCTACHYRIRRLLRGDS